MSTMLITGIEQGIIWAIMVIGVYISFRILDFADLSIESTFPLGACIASCLIFYQVNPFIATFMAFVGGMLGGLATSLLHTKLKIPGILAGIITMTGLYAINRLILGFANANSPIQATLPFKNDVFSICSKWLVNLFGMTRYVSNIISIILVGAFFLAIVAGLIYWLFGTEIGMNVRATGSNPRMARAQGINTDRMIIYGLMLSNGLIALSGALFAQDFGTANVESGRGAIVIGLAAIIIGEMIFGRRTFKRSLISIIIGSVIFFLIKAFAIYIKVDHYLDLVVAILVAVILALPIIKSKFKRIRKEANPC